VEDGEHPARKGVPQSREVRTELPGPRSRALDARRRRAVAPGVASSFPAYVARASGAIVEDLDGNRFIDLGSGIAVTGVGHAAPEVVAAVQAQVAAFTHTCFMVAPYEPYVAVCEELNALTPGDHDKTSALFNSGAEAVENAVKIARVATGRPAVVVFDHAYHGRTNLTMAMTAKVMPYKQGFGPFAPEVYPAGMTGAEAAGRAIDEIEVQVGSANVAALVVEPILGEGGFIVPADGFLPALADWCRGAGVVFVADEIQSGFGRTGDWYACEHEGVVPDLVASAKGIAAGLPLAAVTGRAELMATVHAGGLGGTYGGNPVACVAALAAVRTMRALDLPAAARHLGDVLSERLAAMADRHPGIGDVRGRGAMFAIEFVRPGTKAPDATATKKVVDACHTVGVIVLSCGTYGNVIRLLPPFVISNELLGDGLDVVGGAVDEVLGDG
jgi:4-aminobutyrate aminotransferase/(S)-3-amino-2-methylpropionate transaminase